VTGTAHTISEPGAEALDDTAQHALALAERRRARSRRRLGLWGAFLLVGLLLGAVYATGFAEVGGKSGTLSEPAAFGGSPAANEDGSELSNLIAVPGGESLTYDWAGRWGSVESQVMYEMDLTSFEAGNLFYAEVMLANVPSGFSSLQLQLRMASAAGSSCAVSDLEAAAASDYRVMTFDTADSQVTFAGMGGATTGLAGNAVYCIGVVDYPGSGKDTGGTFIRKKEKGGSFTGAYPRFVASLNYMG
jgi:hypothetical protein